MGGRHEYTEQEWQDNIAKRKRAAEERFTKEAGQRKELARKIVTMLIDQINADIIRPGPVSEERECYDMAEELRQHKVPLMDLVSQILTAEAVFVEKG